MTSSIDNQRESTERALRRARQAGVDTVKFRFGQMAAGHCTFSKKMDGRKVPIARARPLPDESCDHPDQCGCRWQSWVPLMG